jgi:hypothetical protein
MASAATDVALAEEAPTVHVAVSNVINVYTATPASSSVPGFKPHVNFPSLKARSDGSMRLDYAVGQTHGSGTFGMDAFSSDGGLTWGSFTTTSPSVPNEQLVRLVGQTSYGISSAMISASGTNNWNNTLYTSTNGGLNWAIADANFNTGAVSYVSAYNDFTDIQQYGSMLLGTMYAERVGSATYESVLFASTDGGAHWARRSTIASYTSDPNLQMGSEGPNEGSILQLNNGNLLTAFRTGQVFPASNINAISPTICTAISADQGLTWSPPKQVGVGGDFPQLRKLDDGTVAMTFGRYGAKVMFADPTGARWTAPTVIYNGPGSGYVDMRRTPNGNWCFVYDQSSFYPPGYNNNPPNAYVYNNDQSANLKAAILTLAPQPSTDDFRWAVEYHGDAAPETLGWSKMQAGTVSTRQWAELGQDFFRINTAGVGANQLNYQLSSGSAWQNMRFDNGVVIDLRSRSVPSNDLGSGDLFFDDGVNGSALLQFSGQGIFLQGLGGAAAAAAYWGADHPGFNSYDWQNCRVVIEPDPASGGIFAKVYLNGDASTPILTKQLAASSLASTLRFGDDTGTTNGTFDLDYLRFSAITSQWNCDASASWNTLSNWTTTIPSGVDRTASFGGAITSPRTISLDGPITIGHLAFENPNSYTLAGASSLKLQVSGGAATVSVARGSHVIAVPVQLQSDTTIDTTPATSTLTLTGGFSAAAGVTVTKKGAGTLLVPNLRITGVALQDGTILLFPNGTASGVSDVTSLSISSGAQLDLNNNALIVRGSDAGSWNGSAYVGIAGLIHSGRNAGAWNGSGIVTSQSTATGGNLTTIGLLVATPATPTLGGIPVAPGDVLVMYTYGGDATLDGKINIDDYVRIDSGIAGGLTGWSNGDFNYDGKVSIDDYTQFIDPNIANQGPSLAPAMEFTDTNAVAVPEPSLAFVGGLISCGLLRCRRGRGLP